MRVLAILAVLGCLVFAADLAFGSALPSWADWTLILGSHALSVQICRQVACGPGLSPPARRFWHTATRGLVVMFFALALSAAGFEAPGQVLHGFGALMILWGLVRLPTAERRRGRVDTADCRTSR
jgi:hypothetical protein